MKKILIIGAGGQIGSELTMRLRSVYGNENVVATDMRDCPMLAAKGPFVQLNALDGEAYAELVKQPGGAAVGRRRSEPAEGMADKYGCPDEFAGDSA